MDIVNASLEEQLLPNNNLFFCIPSDRDTNSTELAQYKNKKKYPSSSDELSQQPLVVLICYSTKTSSFWVLIWMQL